jgi:butyryl-CoA dehydrogenase
MRAMFTMMNFMRIIIGLQGLGLAETAYQSARAYARERLQGRSPLKSSRASSGHADAIIEHPDVRRMLLTMKALVEGSRALVLWTGLETDIAVVHPEASVREQAAGIVAFLTPVVKAFLSDVGTECTNLGVQIFGGHGYIKEHGMEQLVRDARITQLYEGTNGVQALDLTARKLTADDGRTWRQLLSRLEAVANSQTGPPQLRALTESFAQALEHLRAASTLLIERGTSDPAESAAAASEYLRLVALVVLGYLWLRMARAAIAQPEDAGQAYYRAKIQTARFFMERILPQTASLLTAIKAGVASLTTLSADEF